MTGRIECWSAVVLERNLHMLSLISSKYCLHVSVELTEAVCRYLSLIICQCRCDKGTTRLLRRTWATETQLYISPGVRRIRHHLKCHRFTAVVLNKSKKKKIWSTRKRKKTLAQSSLYSHPSQHCRYWSTNTDFEV